jgi:hypothetical protein
VTQVRVVRSEWIKLRALRSTWWCGLLAVLSCAKADAEDEADELAEPSYVTPSCPATKSSTTAGTSAASSRNAPVRRA